MGIRIFLGLFLGCASVGLSAQTLKENNDKLLKEIEAVHGLTKEQSAKVRSIVEGSEFMGQGNPSVTKHPMSEAQCQTQLKEKKINLANAEYEKICGAKYMAPLYDPEKQQPKDASACIDQFEFPDMPCTYPVVWTRADEAAEICSAMGKRLCDAHEWEDGCAGTATEPDYQFNLAKGVGAMAGFEKMRHAHNQKHNAHKTWAYGGAFQKGVCAQNSTKSEGCNGGDWKKCGSNTYPTASFPGCRSRLDVYDSHGNAAEHMNLPLAPEQMASRGSKELGHTEMKGSWFIWDKFQAHADQCRWRAPYWHGSRVMDAHSHHNYHLSFRCCKTLK